MIFNGSERERPSTLGRVFIFCGSGASLVALMIKNLSSMRETWVRSLGQEDPLEKGMATYSSILSWRIPWTEEPGRLQSMGSQRIGHDWATNTLTVCTSHCRPYFPLCALRTGTGRQHASGSSTGLTIRQTGLRSSLCYSLAPWPQASHLLSSHISALKCKMSPRLHLL